MEDVDVEVRADEDGRRRCFGCGIGEWIREEGYCIVIFEF